MPDVLPGYEAPVVRNTEGGRELIKMRWGMPRPPKFGRPLLPQHISLRSSPSPWLLECGPMSMTRSRYDTASSDTGCE
jgi:hypothetical protein